ncbi:MAG: HAD family hydrolase [Archaeoglobaceae archaeon]|nr:HAD family hydrolase [Archaeoglobaceae archaeon]MDW8118013.1 HAD family hydrolase [Archaeoglobaceae archaeon]
MKVKAVIFDLDDTLVDFIPAKLKACEEVVKIAKCGSADELLNYFLRGKHGFESHENIADFLRDHEVFSPELFLKCCEIYERTKLERIRVYPGIEEVLRRLKERGMKLAVVTDAENGKAIARLRKTDLEKYFDVIVSADMCGKRKPEPDSILLALEKLGVKAEETVLVGDSIRRDITAGKRVGMMTIFAFYGATHFSNAENVDFIAEKPEDVLKILGI